MKTVRSGYIRADGSSLFLSHSSPHSHSILVVHLTMRFSTLVAFLLPLSALAAPSLVRRDAAAFNQLSKGMSDAVVALGAAFSAALRPPQQSDARDATRQEFISLSAFTSGPVLARVGNAVQEGRQPSNDEYVDTSH